ncbi:hypothetical protein T484DRAFT_1768705 [Baffinella frigidus]|nr:hypothetical protein T484DRAFT_1768705 [Cryptophyta sp. CCMP2293]
MARSLRPALFLLAAVLIPPSMGFLSVPLPASSRRISQVKVKDGMEEDRQIGNWHTGKAESRMVVVLEDDWVRCFSANAGTSEIAVGTAKGPVLVLDMLSGELHHTLEGHAPEGTEERPRRPGVLLEKMYDIQERHSA